MALDLAAAVTSVARSGPLARRARRKSAAASQRGVGFGVGFFGEEVFGGEGGGVPGDAVGEGGGGEGGGGGEVGFEGY